MLMAMAPNTLAAVGYLCGYGLGNLVAMGGFAWLLGAASDQAQHRDVLSPQLVLGTCSLISLAIGVAWITL